MTKKLYKRATGAESMHRTPLPLTLCFINFHQFHFESKKMTTEEFVKIKICALKVSIHCDGCNKKVKKILHKIDGVYKTTIDLEQGKVTVSGDFDPEILIKKLRKKGKRAELWDAPKNDEQNQLPVVKHVQIDNGEEGKKGLGSGQNGLNIQQQQPQIGGQQQPPNQQQMQQAPVQQQMPSTPNQRQMQQGPSREQMQQLQQLQAIQQRNPNQQQIPWQQQIQQLQQLQALHQNNLNQQHQQQGPTQQQMQEQVSNQQRLQQLQYLKRLQDMKMPPQMNMPFGKGPNPSPHAGNSNGPKEEDLSDDDFDDYDEDEDESDDHEILQPQPLKMKPMMGNGQMIPSMMIKPGLNHGEQLPPHMMRATPPGNGALNGGNGTLNVADGAAKAKKGGDGGGNIHVSMTAGSSNHGVEGKKDGGNNANQNSGVGSGNISVQANIGSANDSNGEKKGVGAGGDIGVKKSSGSGVVIGDEVHVMPNMMGLSSRAGVIADRMGSVMSTDQMRQMADKMDQMGEMTAVQGVPAAVSGGKYIAGAGPEEMQLNAYHQQQQQMAAMMMNQQRANDIERFQPRMYARAPPELNYLPPYPYHQISQQLGPFNNYFSEDNTSCSIM